MAKWKAVLVVSVYHRDDWLGGLLNMERPMFEMPFTVPVADRNNPLELSHAVKQLSGFAERWLKDVHASLVRNVVVTVYSLEEN